MPKAKPTNSHVHTHQYSVLEFFQLSIGDAFNFQGKSFVKVDDENGRSGRKKVFFWPTTTIKLPKKLNLEQLNERYPLTAYEY